MPSSPFATHISTEHLCYENAVRRSSLASDYDVDKRLITRRTSTASPRCSPTATLAVPSHTRVPSCRGARRPRGIDRETRVANVSSFTLFKDSWMRWASFTRKIALWPGKVSGHAPWNNAMLIFTWYSISLTGKTRAFEWHASQLIGTWNVRAMDSAASVRKQVTLYSELINSVQKDSK
jgi:hypothetical protein